MNNSSSHHEPSPEFRAQLKREIARAVRSDHLFGPAPAPARARRVVMALGIAGGVALTLFTGMVLGASASYAAAAEPDAPRPTLAIRPISNALSAIGCGVMKTEPHAPKPALAVAPVQSGVAAVTDSMPAPVAQAKPDRAKIAALASQYQSSVVRGDTAAEYIVMVLDAADRYVWSTFGSGNLSIEVAGDTRSRAERMAYISAHSAEYGDQFSYLASHAIGGDSIRSVYFSRGLKDKALVLDSLHFKVANRKLQLRDSAGLFRNYIIHMDSALSRRVDRIGAIDGGARGGGGRGGGGADTATTYKAGWSGTRNGALTNQAMGLDAIGSGNGYSGITGLPSTWVAMSETYFFAPGQLAPQNLRILVVHLTPGTVWTGR